MKLPSKKPRLLQTETVGDPGSSVAVRPTIDIEEGKRPHRKVPMVQKTKQKARPHSLIRWTSLTGDEEASRSTRGGKRAPFRDGIG